MDFLKRLVKGEFSLSFTFWNFLVLCSLLVDQIAFFVAFVPGVSHYLLFIIAIAHVIKLIIACMGVLALFFILKNKRNTHWAVAAFIFSILNLIYLIYLVLLASPLILYSLSAFTR